MDYESVAQFHKALADPTRIQIIEYLMGHDGCCICHLLKNIKKDHSVVSRHIDILKRAGLVKTQRDGRYLFCTIHDRRRMKRMLEV